MIKYYRVDTGKYYNFCWLVWHEVFKVTGCEDSKKYNDGLSMILLIEGLMEMKYGIGAKYEVGIIGIGNSDITTNIEEKNRQQRISTILQSIKEKGHHWEKLIPKLDNEFKNFKKYVEDSGKEQEIIFTSVT